MRKLFSLLLTLVFPMLLFAQNKPDLKSRSLIFRNVTLIDMRSEQSRPNMTVVISGNRIAKIRRNMKIPKNAEVINASGKFLIPGLWDNYTYTLEAIKKQRSVFRNDDCSRRDGRARRGDFDGFSRSRTSAKRHRCPLAKASGNS